MPKPYKLNFYNKKVAQALVGFVAAGISPGIPMDPDEKEAIEMITRLGQWSEDLTDA